MILGIDAYNIRSGGGVTHLVEMLNASDPVYFGFDKVVIWGGISTLNKIDEKIWLEKKCIPVLSKGLLFRFFWHRFKVKKLAEKAECDILFIPGSTDLSGFRPTVTISQNLLPFEWNEMRRFGWSLMTIKFLLLRIIQGHTFRNSDGVIFLTIYAQNVVLKVTGGVNGTKIIIPHGINKLFFCKPRKQYSGDEFTNSSPCRIIYVSIIDVYKHQWHVVQAVALLRSQGIPVMLELVGPAGRGLERLIKIIRLVDPNGEYILYAGEVQYEKLIDYYKNSNIAVFASSCENLPNILLEGMAAGLPIACSSRGPMPEILGDNGIYFNPEDPLSISESLIKLIVSKELREKLSIGAFNRALTYSWKRCADETFHFLAEVAKKDILINKRHV